jgi:tetratricopeptide (TPR) repeat protein
LAAGILVVALAFILASTPVRNSDFWLHLATGRSLWEGAASSFSYLEDTVRASHSWLYDVLVYGGFTALGGNGLVMLKALLGAVLALLLLLAGRVGGSLWISAGTTMLSLVAMGPWLLFRPVFLSYLCFAVTICLLRRLEGGARGFKPFLAMFVLFVIWANLDSWFVLGLLLVACFCVGQFVRGGTSAAASLGWRTAGLLILCGVAGCLVNPNLLIVFEPRGEWIFSGVAKELQADSLLRQQILTPWREVYLSGGFFLQGPGLAFWLLVVLGALSFVLRRGPVARILPWGLFLLLSFFQTQVIPFFAMVAAATLALNVGEWLSARRVAPSLRTVGRPGLLLAGLLLAAAAWIGLFQSGFLEPRSWMLDADPALEAASKQLTDLRRQGRLGSGNGFPFAPESANQLAWFCPEEKAFLNSNLLLNRAQAAEYVAIRRGLLGQPGSQDSDWRSVLRARSINHVVVYSSNASEVERVVRHLAKSRQEWPLLYLGGGAAIFGWRDPLTNGRRAGQTGRIPAADMFAALEKSLEQLAFDPREVNAAPRQAPEGAVQALRWWHAFWVKRPFRAPDLREASLALAWYDEVAPVQLAHRGRAWNACLWAALAAEESGMVGFSLSPVTSVLRTEMFRYGQDDGPLAALYLAVRGARRAIARNPRDAAAYFKLGEAYHRLGKTTRERMWASSFSDLDKVRAVQEITAYCNALRFNPDIKDAHDRLANVFIRLGFKDLALKHVREYVRCVRQQLSMGQSPEQREAVERLMALPERILQKLPQDLEDLTNRFEINASNLKVADRAALAARMGLTGKALEILLGSDVSAFGAQGTDLELKLLLLTGNAEKVDTWMDEVPEIRETLSASGTELHRPPNLDRFQTYACIGNYASADHELAGLFRLPALGGAELTLPRAAGLILAHGVLAPAGGGTFQKMPSSMLLAARAIPMATYRLFPDPKEVPTGLWMVAESLNRKAKVGVLRGLLALECGQIAEATDHFREALAFWRSTAAAPFWLDMESRGAGVIAEHFLKVLDESRRG